MKSPHHKRNVAASVRARLLDLSRQRSEDYNLTLVRYALERFLFRLGKSTHREQFILKGAMLYAVWGAAAYRATRDADFLGKGESSPEVVAQSIREICAGEDQEGGVEFDAKTLRAESIRAQDEYDGVRIRFAAYLGKARIPLQVDVGFGDAVVPEVMETDYPVLLDAPAPNLLIYPREAVIAEKCEAIVKLGTVTSRMKDFYDLVVIARLFPFAGTVLRRAIAATFARRNTPLSETLPAAFTAAFFSDPINVTQWRAFIKRTNLDGAPYDFAAVGEAVRAFVWPVLESASSDFNRTWPAGGPWR